MDEYEKVKRLLDCIYYDYCNERYAEAILQLEEVCKIFIHKYNKKGENATMTKIISSKMKESAIGYYIIANDLLNNPIQLYITSIEQKESMYNDGKGKLKNFIYFKDINGNEKLATVGLQSPLFKELTKIDPDQGDLLEIWTERVENSDFLDWKVKIITKVEEIDSDTPQQKTGLTIDNIPF